MSHLGLTFVYEGELLHSAAVYDQSDFLISLLDAGSSGDVSSRSEQGLTPLHTAARHGSTQCVQLLLERGADPNAISGFDDGLQTPLHCAAHHGHLGCLMVMLEYEVDLTLTNKFGQTAKDVATEENQTHCRNFLIESEARKHQEYEEAKRNDLYEFVANGQVDEAEEVLLSIEDPELTINRYYHGSNTLLYKAGHSGNLEMVKMLLSHGADGRTNADNGISPLYAAAHVGHLHVVELLIERLPLLLNVKMTIDSTVPLHAAAMKGRHDIMALTLKHRPRLTMPDGDEPDGDEDRTNDPLMPKIDVNAQDDSGITPLHYAVRSGNPKAVMELLRCKPILKGVVDCPHRGQLAIDMPMVDGKTPLHDAVLMDKVAIAELLLQNGADVSAMLPADSGTMLQIACERSSVDMVRVLLTYGAKDIDEKVRLHAQKTGRAMIVQLLLNSGVYADSETPLYHTSDPSLHPVSIAWHSKQLTTVDDDWIKKAVLAHYPNPPQKELLSNDLALCLSLVTKINLSKNKLKEVPKMLFTLVSLKYLNLSENSLTSIPDVPSDLEGDTAEQFEPYCGGLQELDVSSNSLKTLPRWVFRLPALTTLNASKNAIDVLPYDMWLGASLKTLLLRKNCLSELPMVEKDYMSSLAASQSSQFGNKGGASPQHKLLVNKEKSINASSVSFVSCRPSWEADSDDSDGDDEEQAPKKSGLDRLDLSSNNLTSVPLGLPCLAPNLSRLILTSNKITDVSSISVFPPNLTMICLSRNTLTRFDLSGRYFVTDRKCYIVLGAEHSRTMSFPQCTSTKSPEKLCRHRNHRSLMHLRQLNLMFNCLSELPLTSCQGARPAGKLECLFRGLQTLDISNNAFREVPLHVGQLSKLGSLSLSGNVQIDRLPPELGLCSDLYELRIEKLRISLKSILHRDQGNDKINAKEVTSHLKSLYENSQPYRRIKLMFVGVSNIGKTSLLHALRREGSGTYQSPTHQNDFVQRQKGTGSSSGKEKLSTVGVDVCDWTYQKRSFMNASLGPEVTFGTWDFGGQKEYYATHQCFLSHRALYLLLWKLTDKAKGIDDMEGWLLNIQARAPDSPVIIVGTHFDELPGSEKRQKEAAESFRQLIMTRYMSKEFGGGIPHPPARGLPRVLHVTEVSCGETEFQVKDLRSFIYDTALSLEDGGSSPVMESRVPAIYVQVEAAVKRIKSQRIKEGDMPVINEVTFKSLLQTELQNDGVRLRNAEEFEASIRFLHDNGLLLHYDDPSLRDLYFVDPQWLCDMLAHIISVRDVNPRISGGLMKVSDLSEQIFRSRRFPTSFVNKYIDLMSKFEVAIKVTNRYLLVPSLLPEKQKNCPKLSKDLFPVLRNAMDMSAYLDSRVFRRQYLMSYVPSGFWARVITRLIADDRICAIVADCCTVVNHSDGSVITANEDKESLTKIVPPEWACWRTGIELAYFGVKLLRVSQLPRGLAFYGSTKEDGHSLLIGDSVLNSDETITTEIIAPSVSLTIEKFTADHPQKQDGEYGKGDGEKPPPKIAHRVLHAEDKQCHTACRFLALVVEHFDNLLSDWYYVLDMHISMHGCRGVQRLSLCPTCLRNTIEAEKCSDEQTNATEDDVPKSKRADPGKREVPTADDTPAMNMRKGSNASSRSVPGVTPLDDDVDEDLLLASLDPGCIIAFPFEEGVKRIDISEPLKCIKHGEQDFKHLFPDIMFEDFAHNLVISSQHLQRGKFLAVGGYGAVFKGTLRNDDNHSIDVAIKIPMNTDAEGTENPEAIQNAINNRRLREGALTTTTNNAYRSIRQELSILVPVKHDHIVGMVGVAMSPLSLVIEFAPSGALNHALAEIKRASKRMDPYVLQKCIVQVSSALQYLHKRNIIYRDLKSENVLVWSFPGPSVPRPGTYPVLLKLTDYGISRSVAISGTRGMLGTHGFMAPEIIQYRGRESYTIKVDSFSFGMLMYEMIALTQPFSAMLGTKGSLADQLILDGKRPRLTAREKYFPIPVLALLYRCWAQKPDDRPTSSDILNSARLLEFSRLIDAMRLGEKFSVQCLVACSAPRSNGVANAADSKDTIGSSIWLCGHEDQEERLLHSVPGVVSVLSYKERKCSLRNEIQVLDRVLLACAVGNTIWIGTLLGAIHVYCALSFKPLALGRLLNHRSLLAMLHSPICHCVLVTLADGSLFRYNDNLASYVHTIATADVDAYYPGLSASSPSIKELIPAKIFCGDLMTNRIHSLAAVPSFANDRVLEENVTFFGRDGSPIAATTRDTDATYETPSGGEQTLNDVPQFELWCGQERGYISVLDVNTLQKIRTLPMRETELSDPTLKSLLVRFMETRRSFTSTDKTLSTDATDTKAASIWIVVYPGTEVCRWDVNCRKVVAKFDACLHGPQNELTSAKSSKRVKTVDASKAQISALLVVESVMYVGTTYGCLVVCDADTLTAIRVIRCFEHPLDGLVPVEALQSRRDDLQPKQKLIICSGRGLLGKFLKGKATDQQGLLTFLADRWS